MRIALLGLVAAASAIVGAAHASDGVLELNQTCAENTGCFNGDWPGWPVTISASGSYRLASDLFTGNGRVTAIEISNRRVALDLKGFEIGCRPSPFACPVLGTAGYGVNASGQSGITVRNGRISRLQQTGVEAGARARIEDLEVYSLGSVGMLVGDQSIVHNNIVSESDLTGIRVGIGSTISGNTARDNAGDGAVLIHRPIHARRQSGHLVCPTPGCPLARERGKR